MTQLVKTNNHPATQAIADRWTLCTCTLNGQPAKIVGCLNQFATVITQDGRSSAEFSWYAVGVVMSGDQKFYS